MLRVGVLGASGYTGGELLRYLAVHPSLELGWATAASNAGRRIGEIFPGVPAFADTVLDASEVSAAPELDLAFLALPHGAAAEHGRALLERGVKVVDLSADWRLRDAGSYDEWYGWAHPHPDELPWTYGLPERYRAEIAVAAGVANPGCYPTAAVLALYPVVSAGAIASDRIVIDAATGVSGAGRKVDAAYLFTELDGSYVAYGVGTHRHTPEIEQELGVRVTFTPHLAPMARGELVTCYGRLTGDASDVRGAIEEAYADEPFVHVLPDGVQPATKQVSGSNHALIGVEIDRHSDTAVITCAIDNMGKGASGQAVQNANIMLGLEETAGLGSQGMFP